MAKFNPKPALETPQERLNALEKSNLVFFWKPYEWQKRLLETIRKKLTTAAISSNKIGKTACAVCIIISWALGYEPWTGQKKPDEDHTVKIVSQGKTFYYRKSSLIYVDHKGEEQNKPPVDIAICGEDWRTHLGGTIVPELKKWAPKGFYNTKSNEQGVEFFWEWYNGSTFNLLSYTQDVDKFESFKRQGAWEDEPPPKDRHTALSRALMLDQGKTLMTLTPLKEPWVLDDIVLSGRDDIGIVDGLKITDNPDLFNSDMEVLKNMGLTDEQKQEFMNLLLYSDVEKEMPVEDRGRTAETYLKETAPVQEHSKIMLLKMLKFIKDIDPYDVPSRVFGQFKSLVGRVLKEFDESIHVRKFPEKGIPTDWPIVAMIDWHLSTEQAISYWAVDESNRRYLVGETWEHLTNREIADDIIRKKRGLSWRIENAYIDPLSKGDIAYMRNERGADGEDAYTKIRTFLEAERIWLHTASKDKESGIMNIRTWLNEPNGEPSCFLFAPCPQHLYEIARWVYDDDGKPAKEYDHFMENWYRFTLTGTRYLLARDRRGDFVTEKDFNPITGEPIREAVSAGQNY